jgi:hypothetical protein
MHTTARWPLLAYDVPGVRASMRQASMRQASMRRVCDVSGVRAVPRVRAAAGEQGRGGGAGLLLPPPRPPRLRRPPPQKLKTRHGHARHVYVDHHLRS